MSRLGKIPVAIPKGVKVAISGTTVNVEGPKGKLARTFPATVTIKVDGDKVIISRANDEKQSRADHGLTRALLKNLIVGASEGFSKTLVAVGVGYRMAVSGSKLNVSAGFSHPVVIDLPKGVSAKVDDQTKLTLTAADRELLGSIADKIRGIRPPEPYKGKGIRYEGEQIQMKEGKAAGGKGA